MQRFPVIAVLAITLAACSSQKAASPETKAQIDAANNALYDCGMAKVVDIDDGVSDANLVSLQLSRLCDSQYKNSIFASVPNTRIAEKLYLDNETRIQTFSWYVLKYRKFLASKKK